MNRPSDWEPLTHCDPIPGAPEVVTGLGKELRKVAEAIEDAAGKLRSLTSERFWDSDAGRTSEETAQQAATSLESAWARYDAAATAVEGFVGPLTRGQSKTIDLLNDAKALEQTKNAAAARLEQDSRRPKTDADGNPYPIRPGHWHDLEIVGDYPRELQDLRREMEYAQDHVRSAGRMAAAHIVDIASHDGLKDTYADKAKDFVAKAWKDVILPLLENLAEVLQVISAIVGLAALVLCWVPGLGQALAALALGLAAACLLVDLVLLFAGKKNGWDIAADALGVVTGGIGKALSGGVKSLAASAKVLKAAKATEAQLAVRGARTGPELVSSIKSNNLDEAAKLADVTRGKVAQLLGGNLGRGTMDGLPKGGIKELQNMQLHIDKGDFASSIKSAISDLKSDFPGGSAVLDGFKQGASDLKSGISNLSHAMQSGAVHDVLTAPMSWDEGVSIVSSLTFHTQEAIVGGTTINSLVGGDFAVSQGVLNVNSVDIYNVNDWADILDPRP